MRHCVVILASVLLFTPSLVHAGEIGVNQPIVSGSTTDTCGWPTTLSTSGCSASLIHPRAIATAQHCGQPSSVHFGRTSSGSGPDIAVLDCVSAGSEDAMICELAEAVNEVPVTPVTYGCELDELLTVGQEVIIAGFGETSYGAGDFGTKRWVAQTITSVEPGRVIIGNAGDPSSPCAGDSGGPVFVQGEDGAWRVIGTLLGGTTSTPCNSAAQYMRLDTVVANFELATGLDITPCFDGQTGAWDPGPQCGGFFSGDHTGAGSWSNWCSGIPASGLSDACGMGTGDEDTGAEGDTGTDTSVTTASTMGEESSGADEGTSADDATGGSSGEEEAGEVTGSSEGEVSGTTQTTDDTGASSHGLDDTGDPSAGCSCSSESNSHNGWAQGFMALLLITLGSARRRP